MQKLEEKLKNIDLAVDKLTNKNVKFVFLSQDSKGYAKASVAYIYKMALTLKNYGYLVTILHEKNDYINPSTWLGEAFSVLEHVSIENNDLKVGPQDFMVIPEIYGTILEQIQHIPTEKILLIQQLDYLLEPYTPGKSWLDFNVNLAITTSPIISDIVSSLVGIPNIPFISPPINDYFTKSDKPQQPIIAIHCKDARKASKIIKSFYLKYPIYRFLSFKDMHGMTERDMSEHLKNSCLSVWVDNDSTFGTYPVESIKCNVPVIGKIPNIIPEWMTDDNGIWVYDENQIVDLIFSYIKNWMEDTLPENLCDVSKSLSDKYTNEIFNKTVIETFNGLVQTKIEKLIKIKETLTFENDEKEND